MKKKLTLTVEDQAIKDAKIKCIQDDRELSEVVEKALIDYSRGIYKI
jgi:hypothetical protein